MKKAIWSSWVLLLATVFLARGAEMRPTDPPPAAVTNAAPGVAAAQAISTITGVAISPLLGVSAVGAWKYWKHTRTPVAQRGALPWYAQPWFWGTGLFLIALVFIKDAAGTAMPTAFKKPFDVLEAFENKVSALLAAGLFIPLIASIFGSSGPGDATLWMQAAGLAVIDPAAWLNVLTVPAAIVAFFAVWLLSNVINVLILISPWGVIDAALKSARLFLLTTVTALSLSNAYVGAAVSLVIIAISLCLSGWAFRLMVLGTVFGWDLFTLRPRRFRPDAARNRVFLARGLGKVPVRTCGCLTRATDGPLVLTYRPWLVLPARTLRLPEGRYAVGRGILYPEILHLDDPLERASVMLPPRYLGHEETVTQLYRLESPRDTGVIKGFKAVWAWLKASFRQPKPASAAIA